MLVNRFSEFYDVFSQIRFFASIRRGRTHFRRGSFATSYLLCRLWRENVIDTRTPTGLHSKRSWLIWTFLLIQTHSLTLTDFFLTSSIVVASSSSSSVWWTTFFRSSKSLFSISTRTFLSASIPITSSCFYCPSYGLSSETTWESDWPSSAGCMTSKLTINTLMKISDMNVWFVSFVIAYLRLLCIQF